MERQSFYSNAEEFESKLKKQLSKDVKIIEKSNLQIHSQIPLGEGKDGRVMDVTLKANNETYRAALKIPHRATTDGDIGEINILSSLPPHPNLVLFHGVLKDEKKICLITEQCKNGNLTQMLSSRGFNELKLLKAMKDMAAGVEHIHKNGIIHSDIGARNFLVREDWSVCIADFSLSEKGTNGQYTKDRKSIPTVPISWLAPEVARSHANIESDTVRMTAAGDIWSLGITFWEMLNVGKIPLIKEIIDFKKKHAYVEQNLRLRSLCSLVAEEKMKVTLSEKVREQYPRASKLFDLCLVREEEKRPTASKVLKAIEKEIEGIYLSAIKDCIKEAKLTRYEEELTKKDIPAKIFENSNDKEAFKKVCQDAKMKPGHIARLLRTVKSQISSIIGNIPQPPPTVPETKESKVPTIHPPSAPQFSTGLPHVSLAYENALPYESAIPAQVEDFYVSST